MNELKSERYSLDGMPGISHGSEKISLQRNVLMFSGNIMYSALFLTLHLNSYERALGDAEKFTQNKGGIL